MDTYNVAVPKPALAYESETIMNMERQKKKTSFINQALGEHIAKRCTELGSPLQKMGPWDVPNATTALRQTDRSKTILQYSSVSTSST